MVNSRPGIPCRSLNFGPLQKMRRCLSVRGEVQGSGWGIGSVQELPAAPRVPQPEGEAQVVAGQAIAGVVETELDRLALVALQRRQRPRIRGCIPQVDPLVIASDREQAAFGMPGQARNVGRMRGFDQDVARLQVQNLYGDASDSASLGIRG